MRPTETAKLGRDRKQKVTELAYLAGMIDADGCVFLGVQKSNRSFELQVCVAQADEEVPEWIYNRFGGQIYLRQPSKASYGQNPQFAWTITGRKAIRLLKKILPYMVLKKPQAELAIEYEITYPQKTINKKGQFLPLSLDTINKRLDIVNRFRVLNKSIRAKRKKLQKAPPLHYYKKEVV